MRQYSDDDIEVLGSGLSPKPKRTAIWLAAIGIAAIVAAGVLAYVLLTQKPREMGAADDKDSEATSFTVACKYPIEAVSSLPHEITDSINDVVFTMVLLDGYKASLSFEMPDPSDKNTALAVPAADIRADNGEIVCEFIHNKQQLSRGTRKQGFCYISPEGSITVGCGDGEAYKQLAMNNGGTFFRQYALVMDGEIQPNMLKGKATRRALVFFNNTPAVVLSKNRESIYDFSQALADYGVSHAVYLPGGNTFLTLHTDATDLFHPSEYKTTGYSNYLIFNK